MWGLATWDKPQAACLASRIAYGVAVDEKRLQRIDRAEASVRNALRQAGIENTNVRVRDLGNSARIEVDFSAVSAVAAEPTITNLTGKKDDYKKIILPSISREIRATM